MRLVTWNVNGLDDDNVDERAEAAVFTAVLGAPLHQLHSGTKPHAPPEVIVLQEVTPRTFRAHFHPHLTAGGYRVLPDKPPDRETFEIAAVRPPLDVTAVDTVDLVESAFGRRLTTLDLEGPDGPLRVLTGHFDSGTEGRVVRIAQLRQVAAAMSGRAVFAGDANLRKAEWNETKADLAIVDAWEELGEPSSTRVTWRRTTNGEEFKARFDRIFLAGGLRARTMAPLGAATPPGWRAPISDHIGLLVDFG